MESLCIVNITLKFECAYNNAGLSTFYRTVAAVCLEVRNRPESGNIYNCINWHKIRGNVGLGWMRSTI
jgi:hypothetical protein